MELLLNLIWLAVAVSALTAFGRTRRLRDAAVPYRWSLVALLCVLVLLFPVISASDDLHPAQAVVEDASKKVQLAIAPLHLQQTNLPPYMVPAMLALCLMSALPALFPLQPTIVTARALDGVPMRFGGSALLPPLELSRSEVSSPRH